MNNQELIHQYVLSLTDEEKKALSIARSYLKSSFDLTKTIGFIEFLKHI